VKQLGFGTRIACSKKTQKKGCDHMIRREFECAHPRKVKVHGEENNGIDDPELFGAIDGGVEACHQKLDFLGKKVAPKRKRNQVNRHDARQEWH
jgi:hypothetical protein